MHALDVAAAGHGVAHHERVELRLQVLREVVDRGRTALHGLRARGRQVERLEDLRAPVAGPRAGLEQVVLEPLEVVVGAVLELLDLDLRERAHEAPVLVHLDDVVDDLGDGPAVRRDAHRAAQRVQLGERDELAAAHERGHQAGELVGHLRARRLVLDLEPVAIRGELQLPERAAVLEAAAERDAVAREALIVGVVVHRPQLLGRRVDLQRGQREVVVDGQLALALHRLLHRTRSSFTRSPLRLDEAIPQTASGIPIPPAVPANR